MESFSYDLMRVLANNEPVLILNPDEQGLLSGWAESQTVSLISAAGFEEDSDIIIQHLGILIQEDTVDYIFFGMGSSNEEMIRTVVNYLQILMDNKITVVIPCEHSYGLQMRLDSRLFLYEHNSTEISVYESYKIR